MKDFVIECAELLQKTIPSLSWEEAMDIITTDCDLSRMITRVVLKRREGEYASNI